MMFSSALAPLVLSDAAGAPPNQDMSAYLVVRVPVQWATADSAAAQGTAACPGVRSPSCSQAKKFDSYAVHVKIGGPPLAAPTLRGPVLLHVLINHACRRLDPVGRRPLLARACMHMP